MLAPTTSVVEAVVEPLEALGVGWEAVRRVSGTVALAEPLGVLALPEYVALGVGIDCVPVGGCDGVP